LVLEYKLQFTVVPPPPREKGPRILLQTAIGHYFPLGDGTFLVYTALFKQMGSRSWKAINPVLLEAKIHQSWERYTDLVKGLNGFRQNTMFTPVLIFVHEDKRMAHRNAADLNTNFLYKNQHQKNI
jgi:hypothetical protein